MGWWLATQDALAAAEPSPPKPLVVGGRVTFRGETSSPAPVRVELLRDLDPYAEARRRLRGEPEPIIDRATPDASGLFTLEAPEPGLYRVRTTAPGRAPYDYQIAPLVDSIELHRFEPPESAEPIVLRVLDADGKPIVSPRVTRVFDLDRRNWGKSGSPWAMATWRTGGTIEVHAARDSKATIEISAPGHETRRAALTSLVVEPVRLARRAGAIERSLVVVDSKGAAIGEAVLVDAAANPITATADDGAARCLLAPGETVHVLLHDGRSATWKATEAAGARLVIDESPAITGVVTGADGFPLAGAWVGASARRDNETGEMLTPRAVATDTAGRYLLPVEQNSQLVAWAAAPGHVSEWGETRVSATAPRRTLDFHLGASAVLEGVVVDGAGSPVLGAEIRLENRGSLTMTGMRELAGRHGRSREGGKFSIALSPSILVELATEAPGFAPHRTEIQSALAGERSNVLIKLGRGASLAGRVVDESGIPVAGAQASLESAPKDGMSSSSGEPPLTATATDDGRFAFDHLPADLYDLAVTAPGRSANRRPGVVVSGTAVDLGDVVLGPGETLAGRVVDEAGSPIAGAIVNWSSAGKPNQPPSHRTWTMVFQELDESEGARTDAEGRFTLTDLSAGQTIDLYADAVGYGLARAARFVLPVEDEVVIQLRRAGSLTGRIVDRDGDPLQLMLSLDRGTRHRGFTSGGERNSVYGLSDTDGRFVVEDLAPGEWQIEVRQTSYKKLERSVEVAAGENAGVGDLVLERQETAEVRGTVTDSRGVGVRAVVHAWSDSQRSEAQTDPSGAYLLPAVPLGDNRLEVRRLAGGAERIVPIVVTEGVNTFDVTLDGATVEGRVIDQEGNGVAGVSVELLPERGSAPRGITGAGGGFVLHDITPGRYTTFAEKPGLTPREQLEIYVTPEGDSGVEIVMTPGAVIRGRILGVPERELANVSVMAFGPPFGPGSGGGARVLADGTYRVDGVAPGEWTIAGIAPDSRKVRKTVMVEPDASVAILDLDFSGPGFKLRGHVAGPDGPIQDGLVTIRNRSEGRDAISTTSWTDHEGGFSFGPLARGTYVIEAYGGPNQDTPIMTRVLTVEDDLEVFLAAPLSP